MSYLNLADVVSLHLISTLITVSTRFNPTTPPPTQINLTPTKIITSTNQIVTTLKPSASPTPSGMYLRLSQRKNPTPTPIPPTPTQKPVVLPTRKPTVIPTLHTNPSVNPTPTPSPIHMPTLPTISQVTIAPPTPTPSPIKKEEEKVSEITAAVNQYRQQHNLSPLQESPEICEVAQKRAQEASQNFSHDGFIEAVKNLDYQKAAENLWQGTSFEVQRIIQGWEQSPSHKYNMEGEYNFGCGARFDNTAAFIFVRR